MSQAKPCKTCRLPFIAPRNGRYNYCESCRTRSQAEHPMRCRNCDVLTWIPRRPKGGGPYVRFCPPCHAQRERLSTLAKVGATDRQYRALLAGQGGVCAICRKPCLTGRSLAVDHDHACCPGRQSCGKCIRGLLCSQCNNGLGRFRDDPDLLFRAADYLEQRRGRLFAIKH